MNIRFSTSLGFVFCLILSLLAGCASAPPRVFEAPAPAVPKANKKLFKEAHEAQATGKYRKAIGLWKEFLKNQPESVEGHNNLGILFYSEDRLQDSIAELEAAIKLSPNNEVVLRNLSRSLQFQVALLKENGEYGRAIQHLQRLKGISTPQDLQKVQFMIEEMEDRIFEQVQNANTVEKYNWFLRRFPTGINAEKARQKLVDLKERQSSMIQSFEDRERVESKGILEEIEKEMSQSNPIMEEDIQATSPITEESVGEAPVQEAVEVKKMPEPAPQSQKIAPSRVLPSSSQKPAAMEESKNSVKPAPLEPERPNSAQTKSTQVKPEQAQRPKAVEKAKPKPLAPPKKKRISKRVIITLLNPNSVLKVRANPSTKSKVLSRLKHGQIRTLLGSKEKWFQIEYEKGKIGWVSKRYSRILEQGSRRGQPQAKHLPSQRVAAAH